MPTLTELLAQESHLLSDGAMGTMLQEAGLDDGGAPELWNVERPEDITAIHERYLQAGARIITTNTFGGTRPRLTHARPRGPRPRAERGRRPRGTAGRGQARCARRRRHGAVR